MATQYKDGTWSNIEEFEQAFETFNQACEAGLAHKFVVGSEKEIQEEQSKDNLQSKLNDLNVRVKEIENEKKSPIIKPTYYEVLKLGQ